MFPIPMVLIGAGERGRGAYATYALRRPEELRVVAVAEPNDHRRQQLATAHQIPPHRCFRHWEDLLDAPLLADVALIATPDDLHTTAALGALRVGYDVVLETPIGQSLADCHQLVATAEAHKQRLIITHSLRYTAFYRALHDILASGRLGEITGYKQERSIALWHTAHQFIRSGFQPENPNPILTLEGVHELDMMLWLLNDNIDTISAVGALRFFDTAHTPAEGVPLHCVEDCPIEAECPFSAIGLYLEKRYRSLPQKGFPYSTLADGDESANALVNAVETTPWGVCVYHMGRSLVDNQTILMKSLSGVNISLNINAHSPQEGRLIQIEGSSGSLIAEFAGLDSHITFVDHTARKENKINFRIGPNGHGGDHGLMGNLAKTLRGEAESLTLASRTLDAHLLVFAAEEARRTQRVVNFNTFKVSD